MEIKSLMVDNFWCFEHVELPINKGLCLIDGWNYDENSANGAGKTGILDAICFALFGQVPRSINIDEVINKKAKKDCVVYLTFEDNGRSYRIERSRKPNALRFFVDNVQLHAIDVVELQQQIEKTLGVTYNIFVNSVYFCQNAKSRFILANDADKKAILTDLLDLDIFDKAYKYVHDELNKLQIEKDMVYQKVNFLTNNADKLKYEKEKLEESYQNFEISKAQRVGQKQQEKISIVSRLDEVAGQITSCEEAMVKRQDQDYDTRIKKYKNKISIVNEVKTLQAKARVEYCTFAQLIAAACVEVDQIDKLQGSCPVCKQEVNEGCKRGAIMVLEAKKQKLIEDQRSTEGQLKEYDELVGLEISLQDKILRTESTRGEYIALANERKGYLSQADSIQKHLSSIESDVANIQREDNHVGQLITNCVASIANAEQELVSTKQQLDQYDSTIRSYGILKDVYRNIKYYIFDTVVCELNNYINNYVQTLFNADVRVVLDTEMKNIKGEIKQKFNTVITMDGVERDLESRKSVV